MSYLISTDIAQDEPDGGIMADEEISADVVSKGI